MFKWIYRKYRNWVGRSLGYGGCYRCGGTWDWTKSHSTDYCPHIGQYAEHDYCGGCFPLCEDCWVRLGTPLKRWPYYAQMIRRWSVENGYTAEPNTQIAIRKAVMDGR